MNALLNKQIILIVLLNAAVHLYSQELPIRPDYGTAPAKASAISMTEREVTALVNRALYDSIAREHELVGIASWYGSKFQGRETANGEYFDTNAMTAAHKTLPFGTLVAVINLENNKSAEVRINDRGPFIEGRIIDLSRAAATALDFAHQGIAEVVIRIVKLPPESKYVTVQISAFSDKDNAYALQDELQGNGVSTSILHSQDKKIYRVSIAKLPRTELETTKTLLAKIGYASPLIKPYQQ